MTRCACSADGHRLTEAELFEAYGDADARRIRRMLDRRVEPPRTTSAIEAHRCRLRELRAERDPVVVQAEVRRLA